MTGFGASPELTSTEKAAVYRDAFTAGCLDALGLLGSDKEYHDTTRAQRKGVKLMREWKRYDMKVPGEAISENRLRRIRDMIALGLIWAPAWAVLGVPADQPSRRPHLPYDICYNYRTKSFAESSFQATDRIAT